MDSFPAFFPLTGRIVVIAGSGEAAETKARLFAGSPARLVRLAETEAVAPAAYAGAALAFVAGGELAFRAAAAAAARSAGVPVNVVDHPELCDFITPAIVDRGAVVAAVGASGAAPMLASLLRNDLEARIPEGAGRVAVLFRNLRDEVKAVLPELADRRAFLARALRGPAAEAAMAGDMAAAERLLRAALGASGEGARAGAVIFILAGGPADLLSLRAARVLAEADVLVLDSGCPPAVLGMARRDAARLDPDAAPPARLAELALAGKRLARVLSGPLDPATAAALAYAGVNVEVLRPAPE